MKITYETLDDFLEEIRKAGVMGTEKEKVAYISVVRIQNADTNIMSAQINMQIIKEGNVLTYTYTDLPEIKILSPGLFDATLEKEDAESAKLRYDNRIKAVNDKIQEEYNKLKQLFDKYGYTQFIRAMIE